MLSRASLGERRRGPAKDIRWLLSERLYTYGGLTIMLKIKTKEQGCEDLWEVSTSSRSKQLEITKFDFRRCIVSPMRIGNN